MDVVAALALGILFVVGLGVWLTFTMTGGSGEAKDKES